MASTPHISALTVHKIAASSQSCVLAIDPHNVFLGLVASASGLALLVMSFVDWLAGWHAPLPNVVLTLVASAAAAILCRSLHRQSLNLASTLSRPERLPRRLGAAADVVAANAHGAGPVQPTTPIVARRALVCARGTRAARDYARLSE